MKKIILSITVLALVGLTNVNAQTITSVASGNWTSFATWNGVPPLPGSDVIINHTVTLNTNYIYNSGSITVNSAGKLNGNSNSRILSVTGGSLTVSGSLDIARVAVTGSSTITNTGTFKTDSLFNSAIVNNNTGGTIDANDFLVSNGGTLTNHGNVISNNFLNIATVTNYGIITTTDLSNSKSFTNAPSAAINVNHTFLNSETSTSPCIFTNNGLVTTFNDWINTHLVNGSGKFCTQGSTTNSGTMSGSFDFCDQSGGSIDLNTGTVAGTITYCQSTCVTGVKEDQANTMISAYPNPSNGAFSVTVKNISANTKLTVYNALGGNIYSQQINSEKTNIDLGKQSAGIYFYQVKNENGIVHTGKISIE